MDDALLDGAFFIGGHGAEERRDHDHDIIVVPKDCIIVVLMQYGELMPRVKLVEILQKLYELQKQGKKQGQGRSNGFENKGVMSVSFCLYHSVCSMI